VILVGFMAVFMISFASAQSFWLDELWAIAAIANKGILHILKVELIQNSPYNLPFYTLILKLFYTIFPYGEVYMHLSSIAFVIAGTIILAKVGKTLGGENLGFLTLCVTTLSSTLITQGGWEIRPYAITFCFSSLMLLFYIKRLKQETHKNIILYGVSLIFFVFTHWFACLLTLFFALMDLCLFLRKKIKIKCILSYLLPAAFIVPWFILVVLYHKPNLSEYWAGVPRFPDMFSIVKYLLSWNKYLYILFFIGVAYIAIKLIQQFYKKEPASDFIWVHLILCIGWMISITFIYSKFINPKGSIFVHRYFFCILPQALLLTAIGAMQIFNLQIKWNNTIPNLSINGLRFDITIIRPLLFLLLFIIAVDIYKNSKNWITSTYEPYREVAEYLTKDSDSKNTDSLVISNSYSARYGWQDYYFIRRGFTLPSNMAAGRTFPLGLVVKDGLECTGKTISPDELLMYSKVYLFQDHEPYFEELIDFFTDNYSVVEIPELRLRIYTKF
jgi:hypothetical protein